MPTLFLIEDEDTLAKNIERYLERHGWDVEVAGTGRDPLEGHADQRATEPSVGRLGVSARGQ